MAHWIEAAGLVAAIAASKLYDARMGKKKDRHAEAGMDSRIKSILNAVTISQQSSEQEFSKVHGRLSIMEGSVETVVTEVKGLRERELQRLEDDARPSRRRRR